MALSGELPVVLTADQKRRVQEELGLDLPEANLSEEQSLILEGVRRAFGEKLAPHIEPSTDWAYALELVFSYGLAPLVHSGLASQDQAIPSDFRSTMRAAHAGAVLRTKVLLEPSLRLTIETLQEAGIEPIVLKGAALAYTAYPEPAHRTLGDIDLLVRAEELGRAGDILDAKGFQTDRTAKVPNHHIHVRYAPNLPMGVELHHSLLSDFGPYTLDLDELRSRAMVEEVAGIGARVLAPLDALLLTCLHVAYSHRYQWFPLRGLIDILALTTRYRDGLDWDLFVDTVRRSRASGAVYWPLLMSRDWLGTPVPERVLASLAPAPALRWLVAPFANPAFVLDGAAPQGSKVLYGLLLELSLYGGCSVREQVGAATATLFPRPEQVTHLPPEVTRSRLRYTARLLAPRRLARGTLALGRLVRRLDGGRS